MLRKQILPAFMVLISLTASGDEDTLSRNIDRIQIQAGAPNAAYYFFNGSGWGSASCPGATYAYLYDNDSGAKAMLSLAVAAKLATKTVKFQGNCDGSYYFRVAYIFLDE